MQDDDFKISPPPPPPPMPNGNQSGQGDDNSGQNDDNSGGNEPEAVIVPVGKFGRDGDFGTKVKLPSHDTSVDERYFLQLLAGSISLSINEKKKIINNFGKLSQFQIDELIKIFEEEKSKFSSLDEKHKKQLKTLEDQHKSAWDNMENQEEETKEQQSEADEADEIRKNLGL